MMHEIYHKRVSLFEQELKAVRSQIAKIANIRLLSFGLSALAIYQAYEKMPMALYGLVPAAIAVFVALVAWHNRYKLRRQELEKLILINKTELEALDYRFSGLDNGAEFGDVKADFSYDLDIFGERSIFQYINRSATREGKHLLALWLANPLQDCDKILERQAAVSALAPMIDFRQNLQVQAIHLKKNTSSDLKMTAPAWSLGSLTQTMLLVAPVISVLLLLLSIFGFLSVNWLFLSSTIFIGFAGVYARKVQQLMAVADKQLGILKQYLSLLRLIESAQFSDAYLKGLQERLFSADKPSSHYIEQLTSLFEALMQSANLMGLILNGLILWSLQVASRIGLWFGRNQRSVEDWFAVVAEMDALAGLANVAHNYPSHIFPKPTTGDFIYTAEALAHPLIPSDKCVRNDANFRGWAQVRLISGANMAGKSTYLRTVGVNLVLAMLGAPVSARTMAFTPVRVLTSMRMKDSLQENESFFYAELKRLHQIIETLQAGQTVFVILDEILKGTNSKDQHTGAKALIEQLVRLRAVGMIATHDLSLGELQDKYPNNVENQCFEIAIEDGELKFDYLLRSGISRNLNATFLMRKMGIIVTE